MAQSGFDLFKARLKSSCITSNSSLPSYMVLSLLFLVAGVAVGFYGECPFTIIMTKAAGFVVFHLFHGDRFMTFDVQVMFRMTALAGKSLCSMIFMAEYHRTEARLHADIAAPDLGADGKGNNQGQDTR
jgi:hypothetical protein